MIVVDASVLGEALLNDRPSGHAARAALAADPHWAAPAHLLVEVMSLIRGRTLGRKLSPRRAEDAVRAVRSMIIDQVGIGELIDRIWQLRGNVTAYDAAYVAAAELLSCPLVTADARLARVTGVRCRVRVISGA